jgi:DNA-binding beta-propeller fold protein YncE
MAATKELLIIDAATRKETGRMKLESVPLGVAFSDDGKTVFVTVVDPDAVLKIDLEKLVVTGRGDPGKGPDGVAVFGF